MRVTAALPLALALAGCDVLKDLAETNEKQGRLQQEIQDRYGWETLVGWDVQNGVLTRVTVVFDADEVRGEQVSALEDAARWAVARTFNARPAALFIQVASTVD